MVLKGINKELRKFIGLNALIAEKNLAFLLRDTIRESENIVMLNVREKIGLEKIILIGRVELWKIKINLLIIKEKEFLIKEAIFAKIAVLTNIKNALKFTI